MTSLVRASTFYVEYRPIDKVIFAVLEIALTASLKLSSFYQ